MVCVGSDLPLLGDWTATSNTDSLLVSGMAPSTGQPARSMKSRSKPSGSKAIYTYCTSL